MEIVATSLPAVDRPNAVVHFRSSCKFLVGVFSCTCDAGEKIQLLRLCLTKMSEFALKGAGLNFWFHKYK